jgi:hypothetical protein
MSTSNSNSNSVDYSSREAFLASFSSKKYVKKERIVYDDEPEFFDQDNDENYVPSVKPPKSNFHFNSAFSSSSSN